jgi:hypothetical protein
MMNEIRIANGSENFPVLLLSSLSVDDFASSVETAILAIGSLVPYHDAEHLNGSWHLLYNGLDCFFEMAAVPVDLQDYQHIFCTPSASMQSALAIGLGSNLDGGWNIAPIVSEFLALVALLSKQVGAERVAWRPSALLSDPEYFRNAVDGYRDGGVFPVLCTVALNLKHGVVTSKGLSWFAAQEIELQGMDLPESELLRRAVRSVHDIAVNGPVLADQTLPDLDADRRAELQLDHAASLVKINIRSAMDAV